MEDKNKGRLKEHWIKSMNALMGSSIFYILEDKKAVRCQTLLEWGEWMEKNAKNRILDKTRIRESEVSTVFLGLDHSYDGGPPLLFETMIFGGTHNNYQQRYSTYQQAMEGHQKACQMVVED